MKDAKKKNEDGRES